MVAFCKNEFEKKLLKSLRNIEDFRVDTHKVKYPLEEVLFLTLIGLTKGYVTFKDLHTWMKFNNTNSILNKLLNKEKIAIPSISTLNRILINVDNNELEKVFREYFLDYSENKNIAIDGKFLRGSDINGQYVQSGHKSILNIFDKDTKIVVGHKFLDQDKQSEIPAFKELLKENFFSDDSQIFSFDALLTQVEILNDINQQGKKYIAKVKGNQPKFQEQVEEMIALYSVPTDLYLSDKLSMENNNLVDRKVEIFQSKNTNIAIFSNKFDNIQTLIKVTKNTYNPKTKKEVSTVEYLVANFKTTAEDFHNKILEHWRVETYHYHLDMLTKEDSHIAYVNPFSISILRSFAINLYQLYLNEHKGKKLGKAKVSMAEIKRHCHHSDEFVSELFEI
jgi:predicted transposase YbfD/YdcC